MKNENELYDALSTSFELAPIEEISLAEIRQNVTNVIRELLDKNMEKLMSILYRIDVNQSRTDEIMSSSNKDDVASQLAEEIIMRQLQKIETRNKYKS